MRKSRYDDEVFFEKYGQMARSRLGPVSYTHLDVYKRQVLTMLQQLHAAGNTVVLITHDNSIAVQAQRIIRLEDGHVVYDGPADAPEAVVTPRAAGAAKGGAGA